MKPEICDKDMTFKDCELTILRAAIDKSEEEIGKKITNSPEIIKVFNTVENFIKRKNLIAYGGIALNSLLPKKDQFYDLNIELPDYDFFSPDALNDAKELADIYVKEGFTEVEAKPGVHHGTYKVFVNFIPVADITFLHKELFNAIKKDAIRVSGILYAPPNYLRMSMYLELSRPEGDKSRWEKVLKRLILLNKYYPLTDAECRDFKFQRRMENFLGKEENNIIYDTVKNTFIDQGVVFFGGYALSLYSKYMPYSQQQRISKLPDFDVLSEDPETTAEILKERLIDKGIKNVNIVKKEKIGEIVAPHYMINIGKVDTVAFIYEPLACHSYNVVSEHGKQVKVATIDTMLSFYLAFIYSGRPYYDINRILCMAHYLFRVQQQNRLEQKGLLKRFSIQCYGHQQTIEEMRAEKSDKYKELKNKRDSPEYEEYFLRYRPGDHINTSASTVDATAEGDKTSIKLDKIFNKSSTSSKNSGKNSNKISSKISSSKISSKISSRSSKNSSRSSSKNSSSNKSSKQLKNKTKKTKRTKRKPNKAKTIFGF